MTGHVVMIDTETRLVAVARLAGQFDHVEARRVLIELAKAVGVHCRGGQVFIPRRQSAVARGWTAFCERIRFRDSELRHVAQDMADQAVASGASVTLSAELVDQLTKSRREADVSGSAATLAVHIPGGAA